MIQETLAFTLPGTGSTGTELLSSNDGSAATGIEYSVGVSGEGLRYQQLWHVVRDGALHHLYVDAAERAGMHVLTEVMRECRWT